MSYSFKLSSLQVFVDIILSLLLLQVTEKEGFTWKGHSALTVRTHEIKMASGYQPSCVVQVNSVSMF